MNEVIASSFSPQDGRVGMIIHVTVPAGAIAAEAGTLSASDAYFRSIITGSDCPAEILIMDHRTYTSFTMEVPLTAKAGEHYEFYFTLSAREGSSWQVKSPPGQYFTVLTNEQGPVVTNILPSRVSKQRLPSITLLIEGTRLDRLEKTSRMPQILLSPPINLKFGQGHERAAQLRVVGGTDIKAIRPGSYRINFFDGVDGSIVFSQGLITLAD